MCMCIWKPEENLRTSGVVPQVGSHTHPFLHSFLGRDSCCPGVDQEGQACWPLSLAAALQCWHCTCTPPCPVAFIIDFCPPRSN